MAVSSSLLMSPLCGKASGGRLSSLPITNPAAYVKFEDLHLDEFLVFHLADLSLTQQKEWLRRYRYRVQDCKLTEQDLDKIATSPGKNYQQIRELIHQPILL